MFGKVKQCVPYYGYCSDGLVLNVREWVFMKAIFDICLKSLIGCTNTQSKLSDWQNYPSYNFYNSQEGN